ncbi:hypothetical protein BJ165DRAFT_742888 [Panaeolus papilionaceus]|nr:hypothetical protein BJ165DRAFT_742888 [Panaeolus papilionaceus]
MSTLHQQEVTSDISFALTREYIFPPEIFFKIFAALHAGNHSPFYEHIYSCRLVCKHFNEICLPVLVWYVELGYAPPSSSIMTRELALRMLQARPSLGSQHSYRLDLILASGICFSHIAGCPIPFDLHLPARPSALRRHRRVGYGDVAGIQVTLERLSGSALVTVFKL